MRYYLAVTAAALLATAAFTGCSSTATPPATVTVTATPTPTPVAPEPVAPAEPEPAAPAAAAKVTVPNGVGMNYQAAQDKWRAAGLYVMPATDATGANRVMILDANWVVLGQSPKAGTKVAAGSDVTATVKKYTD